MFSLHADPFDDDLFSTPSFPMLSSPPGFAPIGPPGSLPGPTVRPDTWAQALSSLMQPVSLSSLGSLFMQPVVPDSGADDAISPPNISLVAIDLSVEPIVARHPPPLALSDHLVVSSQIAFSGNQSIGRSLSPTSVQSDSTFYSGTDSLTGQAPVLRSSSILSQQLGCDGPFVVASPRPHMGDGRVGCAYRCTT